MPDSPVAGIFCSDLHLSEKPPIARSVEPNWMQTQKEYIDQLRSLQHEHHAPIFIAGDLFDKWNSSAYLIGSAISWFHGMDVYAIPGNHDIPHHNYLELGRSAYWVLVEAGIIKHLSPRGSCTIGPLLVTGFPYGFQPEPTQKITEFGSGGLVLSVALVHDYMHTEKTGHKDAPPSSRYSQWIKKYEGFDAVFIGDNHLDVILQKTKPATMNCGGFVRRNTNERNRHPCVGLLRTNGKIERHLLHVDKDKFLDIEETSAGMDKELEMDLAGFAEELSNLHSEKLDYAKAVKRWLDGATVSAGVREIILRSIS